MREQFSDYLGDIPLPEVYWNDELEIEFLRQRIEKLRECLKWYENKKVEVKLSSGQTLYDHGKMAQNALRHDDKKANKDKIIR